MPKVQCPDCDNSVIVSQLGHTYQVSGVFDSRICLVLKEREETVSDAMECPAMEAAIEQGIDKAGGGDVLD